MEKQNADAIYQNRAQLRTDCPPAQDCTDYDCCMETLAFAMQDKEHQFSLGLSTILRCLAIAEREGYVPKIPSEWWVQLPWELRS